MEDDEGMQGNQGVPLDQHDQMLIEQQEDEDDQAQVINEGQYQEGDDDVQEMEDDEMVDQEDMEYGEEDMELQDQ